MKQAEQPSEGALPQTTALSREQAGHLAMQAMLARGFAEREATLTVTALLDAERDGLPSHGLSRLPFYLDQAATGKVNARAVPRVTRDGAVVRVDADQGLAFPAVARGLEEGQKVAAELGVCAVSVGRSHHFGVAGAPVESAAMDGFMALAFSNAPSAMAPWGGHKPLFGTNPIAFACPRCSGPPMVLDLSLSKVARGKVMLARKAGQPIPEGWAVGPDGLPTTDPDLAIQGSMVPAGDAKGAALAMMVELLCAGLSGSRFGFEAGSFFEAEGEPPEVGHLILLFDAARFAPNVLSRCETLFAAMLDQPGVRLPGDRRRQLRQQGGDRISLPAGLVAELSDIARSFSGG
ncbi:Ldh family oxidoreductase [Halomonas cupida]|uniref:Ldh family oxidoreductase n=1 Tax=Halomonas TaxID=2745 RepID=UPI001A8F0992|nr:MULTISPECIES: Ldh family oxidoreductase [Halomonas]MBN8412088.1 Ldh family oxidoreductase [Halomonas litopenaei]MBY6028114.1 Ldh family oxidoreductase [Halomonas sp. DP8Y7-1]MED5294908.1 Ldh family oxidoreductase [Pseudomonadota bacterium]MEE3214823.1 Ldh family oxidoreductase [Pseudomonadota bacterium]